MKYKRVYLEITNVCNLSCSFCPKTKRKQKFLSVNEFSSRLEALKPVTKYIYFHLMGEPLLSPYLKEFLDIAYEKDFKINITTNGTLLKKQQDVLLNSPALRQINISLHSFEANNSEISFDQYLEDVIDFINRANSESNVIIAIRLWNLDSYEIKAENKLNFDILSILEEKFSFNGSLKEKLDEDKKVKIGNNLYLNSAEKFQWPTMNIDIMGEQGFCHGLRDHFGILVDGTVVPCCLDGEGIMNLGNINDSSLCDILEGDRSSKIYDGFSGRKRVEELCKRCGYSDRFKK